MQDNEAFDVYQLSTAAVPTRENTDLFLEHFKHALG